jgi:hypothetical protein
MVGQPDRVAAASTLTSIPGGNGNALDFAELATTSLAGLGTPAARFGALSGQLGSLQQGADSALALREDTVAMAEQLQQQASGQPYAIDPQTEAYLAQAVARHRAAHELVEELTRLVAYCKTTLD